LVNGLTDWSPDKVGGLQSLTFWTDNAAGSADELKAKGVELSQEPTAQPRGMTEARLKDPDSNEFFLYGPA
jgi:hypothetical protein